MDARPHLSTLLSQVLIAYTIEADNEFESLMPHSTTVGVAAGEKRAGPWLISLELWSNFLAFVPPEGISPADLSARAGTRKLQVAGMTRWRYVRSENGLLLLTPGGTRAAEIWRPLEARIEERWRERFGADAVASIRSSLAGCLADITQIGPDYLPQVVHGLWTTPQLRPDRDPSELSDSLSAVLCSALTVIAVAFERTSPVSLALAANALRVLEPDGVPAAEIWIRAGIAREITDVSLGYLEKQGLATLSGTGRAKVVKPTAGGVAAQRQTDERLDELDRRFEPARAALETILSNTDGMVDALTPHPMGWRAQKPYLAQTERMLVNPRAALPHFPIVTHRGGFPDGS